MYECLCKLCDLVLVVPAGVQECPNAQYHRILQKREDIQLHIYHLTV